MKPRPASPSRPTPPLRRVGWEESASGLQSSKLVERPGQVDRPERGERPNEAELWESPARVIVTEPLSSPAELPGLVVIDKEPAGRRTYLWPAAAASSPIAWWATAGTLDPDAPRRVPGLAGRPPPCASSRALPKTYPDIVLVHGHVPQSRMPPARRRHYDMSRQPPTTAGAAAVAHRTTSSRCHRCVSAVKVVPPPARAARQGIEVDRPARPRHVDPLRHRALSSQPGGHRAEVVCFRGPYSSVWAHTLGGRCGERLFKNLRPHPHRLVRRPRDAPTRRHRPELRPYPFPAMRENVRRHRGRRTPLPHFRTGCRSDRVLSVTGGGGDGPWGHMLDEAGELLAVY